jgi:diguanylate cyclase (GGDEF)-like protein
MPDYRSIPLLFTTVHSDTRLKVQGLSEGAVDYVTKPFINEELVARVRVQLRIKALQDELTAKNARLEELSRIDYLTQLSNRRHLMEVLNAEFSRAVRHGGALSLVLADIDHFKRTNDQFGHPVGDRCLQLVANTLLGQLRKSDHAARFGGEEFAMVLPETEAEGAAVVAERFRQAVASSYLLVEGKRVPMTVSLGVATFHAGNINSIERLLKVADDALYAAKGAGRNRVVA